MLKYLIGGIVFFAVVGHAWAATGIVSKDTPQCLKDVTLLQQAEVALKSDPGQVHMALVSALMSKEVNDGCVVKLEESND